MKFHLVWDVFHIFCRLPKKLFTVQTSCEPARASSAFFMDKEDRFKKQLKMPFNISIVNAEVVIRDSGIKDWQEEAEYLRNQLSEGQPGCLGHVDKKQKKRDTRIINSINEHSFSK